MDKQGYLLMVDDEPNVQENNKQMLERAGYTLRLAYTLKEARAIMAEQPPRAIVLDIQLPDGNGLDFLSEIRQTSTVPVLILTAMGTYADIIKGLEAGSDDYLAKPYDVRVLLTRVEALLRRAEIVPESLVIGSLKLEPTSGRALLNGEDMVLSQKEYALLQQFVQHPEKTLSAEYLYEKVWGQKHLEDDSSLKNTAYRLRKKLDGSGYSIIAERGEGYLFEHE